MAAIKNKPGNWHIQNQILRSFLKNSFKKLITVFWEKYIISLILLVLILNMK